MKFNQIKKIGKYVAGLVAAGALLSTVIFPVLGMKANAPRFNFLNGDEELITGARGGSNTWGDPISVSDGDTFAGRIYYHNGIVDSIAENTRVKVNLPEAFRAGNNTFGASISAANAETVSDTIIDGVINGRSGLTVNAAEDFKVDYVPGTVKWYPNARLNNAAEQPLLNGQSGAELFGANGLSIGNINGCWDYAGWVTFVARVHKISTPNLAIVKSVKNVTAGTNYVESVEARQPDIVNFKLVVNNNGNVELENVKVFDQLPSDLAAVDGTGCLTYHGSTIKFALSDLLSPAGVLLNNMAVGENAILTFDAIPNGPIVTKHTATNVGIATSGNLQKSDNACVVLLPPLPPIGTVEIHRAKSAWNLTKNANAELVPACVGDDIEYTLHTVNVGTLGAPYIVSDNISDILEYADVVASNGGIVNPDSSIVFPETFLAPGCEILSKFVVRVRNPLPPFVPADPRFDDVMENIYGNAVVVHILRPILLPELSIVKFVRNVSQNEALFVKANTAFPGDVLEYKILFRNTGAAPADFIKISDLLPANVALDISSPAFLGIDGREYPIAENIQNGFILQALVPGQEAYICFRAIIDRGIAANELLVNTAYLEDNGEVLCDTAQTVVKELILLTKVNPVPRLPRTGATDSILISLIAAVGGTGSLAFVRSKINRK